MNCTRRIPVMRAIVLVLLTINASAWGNAANKPPVAKAGSSRYVGNDLVKLDGRGSYDPDQSGPLSYAWTQVSGPPVVILMANTATPLLLGFVQTDVIQRCEFQLVVTDGELTSRPDTVDVIIVPLFGATTLKLENAAFDPNKPTFIYFGGGDCVNGYSGQPWNGGPTWMNKANVVGLPSGYAPDSAGGSRTYYRYGDMIIAYLSSLAPSYRQPIQTAGWSTGGQPAIDVAIHLNTTYRDARYVVNHVTLLDATPYCRASYQTDIDRFLASPVGGRQCWIDNYVSTPLGCIPENEYPGLKNNVLNVWLDRGTDASLPWIDRHSLAPDWYEASVATGDARAFRKGVVGGAYWSVAGPGKNLQLVSPQGAQTYQFTWYGDVASGHMEPYDESASPGRLPEPVTLLIWRAESEPGGIVLSCKPSDNAINYQLVCGTDPCQITNYRVVSETSDPPIVGVLPHAGEDAWWTVIARDVYGSRIYADPLQPNVEDAGEPTVENRTRGTKYGSIELALYFAEPGDEIIIGPGIYAENIDFVHKGLLVRSRNPDDPATVSATVITGEGEGPAVVFSCGRNSDCLLAGLTIDGGSPSVACGDASPQIRNCSVQTSGPVAIAHTSGSVPDIVVCSISGRVMDPRYLADSPYPRHHALDMTTLSPVLSWHGAASDIEYDVYFGEDKQEVSTASRSGAGVYRQTQPREKTTYEPGRLEAGKTYYWRIDGFPVGNPSSGWKGQVWDFTTAGYALVLSVDDFESYRNEKSFKLYATWVDGYEDPDNGALVGTGRAYAPESKIVHGGKQSMPLNYDNRETPVSQAVRTWAASQNWTTLESDTLTLYFCGEKSNSPQSLYVMVEDARGNIARVIHPDQDAVLSVEWRRWQIPLANLRAAGVDMAAVKKMVIGVGDRQNPKPGGTGRIYIDDIRLTKRMP